MPHAPPINRLNRSFGRRPPPPKPPRFPALRRATTRATLIGRAAGEALQAGAARARAQTGRMASLLSKASGRALDHGRRRLALVAPRGLAMAHAVLRGMRGLAGHIVRASRRLFAGLRAISGRVAAGSLRMAHQVLVRLRHLLAMVATIDLAGRLRQVLATLGGMAIIALLGGLFVMANQESRTAGAIMPVAVAVAPPPVTVPPRPPAATREVQAPEPEPDAKPEPVMAGPAAPTPAGALPPWRRFAALPAEGTGPKLAIVIDDLGLDGAATRRLAALEGPLTLAFLPYAADLPAQTALVRAAGHELLVHLPMAPRGGLADPGPMALSGESGETEMRRRIAWNLSRFEGYVGVNNHMGSGLTENATAMRIVMQELAERGRLFLDSRTTPATVARRAARSAGIPNASRDIFLDNDQDARAVEVQFDKLEALARRHGTAIGIGHPHAETLATLERRLQQARARGFVLVPISALVDDPGETRIAAAGTGNAGTR